MTRQRKVLQAAKVFEQSGQDRDALELYRRYAREGEGGGAIWLRVVELELQLGNRAAASAALREAIEAFHAAGQTHNALALCFRLLALAPGEVEPARRLLQLAGSCGYARSARDAVEDHLLHGSGPERYEGALSLVHEYLEYFPADDASARRWLEQMVTDLGRESALRLLTTSWNEMRASAPPERAELFLTLLSEVDTEAARESSVESGAADGARQGKNPRHAEYERPAPEREIPVVSQIEVVAAEVPLEPLAGFEPTNLTDLPDDDGPIEIETLPLLDHSAGWGGPSARIDGERELPDGGKSTGEPLDSPDRQRFAALVAGVRRLSARPVPAASSATHYDLALGYKEMEMLDEALSHSAAALEAGYQPRLPLELMGELLVERDHRLANEALQLARKYASASGDGLINIYYWLARNEEALGHAEEARALLKEIVAIEPSFRDAALRLDRITSDPF